MTIASEITRINNNIASAYTAVSNKGGTLPATQNSANLATAIGSISGGSTPVINSLTVTPTTSQQTITAPSGVDGYSPVNVSAVTSAIDANISAGNIKSGVSILGVSGSVTELVGETRSVSLTSSSGNTFTPTSGKNGITSITVTPNNQARSVTPSKSAQTLNVNSGYSGNGTISVSAVTSSIDNNITAGNIKKDVTILGVTGTYEGGGGANWVAGIDQTKFLEVVNGKLQKKTSTPNALTLTMSDIGSQGAQYMFYACTGLTSVSFPALTTISGNNGAYYMFYACKGLTSVSFPALTTISGSYGAGYMFDSCTGLTSVDLSALTTISGSYGVQYMFRNCTRLTSVSFPALTTISGNNGAYYMFYGCTGLTSVSFPALTTIGSNGAYYMFRDCTGLTSVSFPALTTSSFGSNTNQFSNMLSGTGTSKTHTLHFPSNLQSTISGLSGYPNFGGTSGKVVLSFDLPATS